MHMDDRRRILTSALAIGTSFEVAGSWTAPVIERVFLPAHAQTTDSLGTARSSRHPGDAPLEGPGFSCRTDRSAVPPGETLNFRIEPLADATETIRVELEQICDGQPISGRGGAGGTLIPGTPGFGTGISLPLDGTACPIGSLVGFRITNTLTNESVDCQVPVAVTTTTLSCRTSSDDGTASLDERVAFSFVASDIGDGSVRFSFGEILNGDVISINSGAILQPGQSAGMTMGLSARELGYQAGDVFGLRSIREDNGEIFDCTVTFVEGS